MKNCIISFGVIIITFGFLCFACSKKEVTEPQGNGKLKLNIGVSVTVSNVGSKLKSALTTENFHVQILNTANAVVKDYAHASDIPESIDLPAGEYHAVASSDNNQAAAFANPYYYGNSGNFTITTGQTTTKGIECSLANIMVTVIYSSKVTGSFSDYSTRVSNSSANLTFLKDETRAGYFDAGPLSIEANLVYTEGGQSKTKTLTGSIANPQVGKHYEINIDASLNNGNAAINVTLNETVVKEVINITENVEEPTTGELLAGDLLITEIMYNPEVLSDTDGEWFELFNNSNKTINLKDLVCRRGSSTTFHKITAETTIAPGEYIVLGRTMTATNNVSYIYGSINLTNTGDELIINTFGTNGLNGTIICSVNYGEVGFPSSQTGKSIQLDKSVRNATDALLGSNWCASTQTYSTGDYGTPGLVNSICD